MRCPKCQYISFDESDRCRNCGYDFSLVTREPEVDLPIRDRDQPDGPMVDLGLTSRTPTPPAAPATPTPRAVPRRSAIANGLDLPLFGDARDDAPLITPPAVPRVPLSVRRAAPVMPRPRPDERQEDEPGLDFPENSGSSRDRSAPAATTLPPAATEQPSADSVPPLLRVAGAFIDATILGAIDAAVIHFTLQVVGLTWSHVDALPPVPMAAFLLMLNGGYLTMFTAAGGQTIGKMVTGMRVVPATYPDGGPRVGFNTATVRAAATLLSLLPAGAGFIMGLLRTDGRTLHDRLADTRVIRA